MEEKLKAEVDSLSKEINLKNELISDLKIKLEQSRKETEEIVEDKCQLEKKFADAKHEISSSKPALQLMEGKICDLQNDIVQWNSKYVSLEAKNGKLTKLLEDVKRQMVKFADELSNKNWKIAKLENQLQIESKLLQQKTDLLADYKTKVSIMKDENIKLQEEIKWNPLDQRKHFQKSRNIQEWPSPETLGDIRYAQIRQFEERVEKLEKEREIYKSLCQLRQKKIEEIQKSLNSLSVDKAPFYLPRHH